MRSSSRHDLGAWRVLAVGIWVVALALAAGGLMLARTVLDRGVTYGAASGATPRDVPIRAVNVQLEMEPDEAAMARTLDMVRDAGLGWIRQQVSWANLEPGHKGNFWDGVRGRPTWAWLDAVARLAAERGLRVIVRVDLPPDWARPAGSFKSHPPSNVRDYADIVAAITSRYQGRIDHVQVWNEPNLSEEWGRRPVDAAAYVELLRAGHEGARRGNALAVVVAASLAQTLEPDVESAAGVDDLTYLDRMYAFGAAPFFDKASANGYGLWTGPSDRQVGADYTNLSRLLLVRDVMARHGDAAKPLWVSEFGWNAEPPGWDGRPSPWGRVDEATKAAWLQAGWNRAGREWPWMGPMTAWLMRQPRPIADDPTQFFALVRPDWSTTPAYDALVADARSPVLGPGTWPDGAPGIEYAGTWQVSPNPGGSLRETPAPNAHMRLRFHGTGIDLVSPVGPQRGVAYVTVNGSYLLAGHLPRNRFGQATIDFGAPEARDAVRFAVASGLPDGEHRLELTVSGDAGTGSSAPGVGIDGVVVTRERGTAPEVLLAVAGVASAGAAGWSLRRPSRAGGLFYLLRSRKLPLTTSDAGSQYLGRGVTWLVLATVAALPVASLAVATPVGRFSPVELLALAAISAGAFAAWLGAHPPEAGNPERPYAARRIPRLADLDGERWAIVLLLVGGTIGATVATYPVPAWREWRLLVAEPLAWYLVAGTVVLRPRGARHLASALVSGAAVAGLVAVGQAVTGVGVVDAEGVERARAFSPSPNNLALLLGRTLPLAVALAISSGGRLAWLAVVLTGAGLAVSWSRGGWIAGAVAVAWLAWRVCAPGPREPSSSEHSPVPVRKMDLPSLRDGGVAPPPAYIPLWGRKLAQATAWASGGGRKGRSPSLRALALGSGAARRITKGSVAVLIAVAIGAGSVVASSRVRSLLDADGSALLRVSVWASALAMIRDHPWLGIGLDQFVYAYPGYVQAGAWREPNLGHPHQFILDAWLRLGVLGVASVGALWWSIWRRNRDASRSAPVGDEVLRHGATAALLAIIVHGLVDNSYFVLDLAYATWAIVLVHRGASARERA